VADRPVRGPHRRADDEGLPPDLRPGPVTRVLVRAVQHGETVVFLALAVLLFAIAVLVLVHTARDLFVPPAAQDFAETVTQSLNGVLFVVIVIEVLRTIVTRLEGEGLRLQPFLVIAIVSTVRHILTVAARLSLEGTRNGSSLIVELLANAAVVLILVVTMVLQHRWARLDEA
jgi:uncharacterized membrane protein (DUF373 family)